MSDIWTKSKWTMEQLDRQTVEFQFPVRHGALHGFGEFLVRQNPDGLLAIDILVDMQGKAGTWNQTRYHVPQSGVDRIEDHPDLSRAHFRLFE